MNDDQERIAARFAICVVQNGAGELLFLKRAADASLGAGKWGFPAGHIEASESPHACALRELEEEIGARHDVVLRRTLGPLRDSFYGGRFEIHLFHFDWHGGSISLNDEHTEYAWADRRRFGSLDAMLGIEEDIVLLGIWPASTFSAERLPPHLRAE